MKLEEEIKQKKFNNEFHKLAVNIIYTHGWFLSLHSDALKKFDITPAQFNILRILRGQHPNPAPVSLLKERMLDKMSDASRLVERLRIKELVERNECPEDRRKVNVLITKKGLELLTELDNVEKETEKIFSKISPAEAKTVNDILDKLRG